ncbi:MAG: NYN domain-containing protein [Patescibacteria group bacterium]
MSPENTQKPNNAAFIDGANLRKGADHLGWELDYGRLRIWLREKYSVQNAYLFLGLIPKYSNLYRDLQEKGYILVFKEVVYDIDGRVKGNCDADLVVQTMRGAYEGLFDKAVLISSDGDYAGLISFLLEKEKMLAVLSPYGAGRCSILIKRTGVSIAYLSDQKNILEPAINKKAPDADGTA